MLPIAGQCVFICQCHQPNLYNETQACCPRLESLKNFNSYLQVFFLEMSFGGGGGGGGNCFCEERKCEKTSSWPLKFVSVWGGEISPPLKALKKTLAICTCTMNTLGRAVEQLAECLAKQSTSRQLIYSLDHEYVHVFYHL